MAGEGKEGIAGWTDCGTDENGKQIVVNLLGLRHIEITPSNVTLYYHGVEAARVLTGTHAKTFLVSAGLRQPESNLIHLPDMGHKLPSKLN